MFTVYSIYGKITQNILYIVYVRVYIVRRQNMVAHYIATRPIMDLCLAAERKPGL